MSTAAERQASLVRLVTANGEVRVDPPMLLGADQYFDLAGEEFGRSLLLSLANDGIEYCLRPEFTLPIVVQYVKQGLAGSPVAFSYMGPVFRQAVDGPSEYIQMGVELLGQMDPDHALDDVLGFARHALEIYRLSTPDIRLGGVDLFEVVLAGADMPDVWRRRIRARFGHPDAMTRLLDRLAEVHAETPDAAPEPIDPVAVAAELTEQMLAAGFNPEAGRRPDEIAARHAEKQALAAAHVPLATVELLRRYLAIADRAVTALEQIEMLAAAEKLDLAAPLAALRRHLATLRAFAPQAKLTFDASFSPRLDYYTGIVFEMVGKRGAVLASGGQYDRLLTRLGATIPVTASGCAVWVDRLEEEVSP
jgi:ATP phosphoribosyltransferase regulatory subunit